MDKTPKPSLVLLALLSALATLPFEALKPNLNVLAQGTAVPVPTFTLPDSVAAGTTVRIDGSPSLTVLNETLAESFKQRYPGTEVTLASRGEAAALQALAAGNIDLAALGRSLSDEEKAQTLTEVPITREKIAIIVGRDNPFQGDLTFGDFAKIFRGEITNWAQVGGPNLPIRFIDRPGESDVRRALSEYEVFKLQPFEASPEALVVAEDNTAAIVRELGNDGISYAIASEVLNQEAVRPVPMHSTLPSDPRYPYSQPRNYVYRGEPSIPVEAFLGFATNTDGQTAVVAAQRTESANVTAGAARLPNGVTLSPDGQFMVRGTESGDLEWLDAQGMPTDTRIANAHRGVISAVVISADGQTVISSGADGTLRRWDRSGNPLGDPIQGSDGPILALALSPDGQTLVSGNADGTVERWSVADGSALGAPINAHNAAVQAISYPAGGQNFITGSSDGSLALWTAEGTPAGRVNDVHPGGVTTLVSSPDGQVLTTTGGDGMLRQWDRATLAPRGEAIAAHGSAVSAAAYSPDGQTLATAGADGTLQLWGPDGSAQLPEPLTLEAPASSLGFTPAGELVIGSSDGQVTRRDITGAPLSETQGGLPLGTDLGDLWRRFQTLPKSTWWLLAAIPLLLILLGLLGALGGGKGKGKEEEDLSLETVPGSGSGIDFSGLAPGPEAPQPPGVEGLPGAIESLPPEAELLPRPGEDLAAGDLAGLAASKLELAKADLAEGKRLLREGQPEAALICFNSVIEATEVERLKAEAQGTSLGGINALATQAQALRGQTLALLGQAGDAMESYNTALGLDSSTVEAWVGKGRLLVEMGRYDEALFCFDSALERDDSLAEAWAGKAQALIQLGRQTEAQTCLDRAAALGIEAGFPVGPYPPISEPPAIGYPQPYPDGSFSPPDLNQPLPPDSLAPAGYDPDVPLELQQMVMGLPSADTDLAYAAPTDYGVPPELAAQVAQLPDTPENAPSYGPGYTPGGGVEYEVPRAGFAPAYPETEAFEGSSLPSLEEALINQVDLSGVSAQDYALPSLPSVETLPELQTPEIPSQPGDFVPPPAEAGSVGAAGDLPPEVLAALANIPPGSPDSLELAAIAPPEPAMPDRPPAPLSWIKVSIDPEGADRFYVVWHLDDHERGQVKAQGGTDLVVRLYDVTGHSTQLPLPAPVQEQRCHDDFAKDWYLPIPAWDRTYVAEVGYLTPDGQWLALARSTELPTLAV
ncbi:MAG TPA: substrate-binding domain-containing protein [Leptolyngbyaceae cyanobacterium M65_K2018_010]|nr:substrate-binding domain-containing protein [Leptolyngbyaceae cyanobacterium M65_K2018_010]